MKITVSQLKGKHKEPGRGRGNQEEEKKGGSRNQEEEKKSEQGSVSSSNSDDWKDPEYLEEQRKALEEFKEK